MRDALPGECRDATAVIDVAEFRDEDGCVRFRVSRYFAADGSRWVCHGPFARFHANGRVAEEGEYRDGLEVGLWRDYYQNGQLASEGTYCNGRLHGYWQFWFRDGAKLDEIEFEHGEQVYPAELFRRSPEGAADGSQG